MYSVVLMMALSSGSATPAAHNGHGCGGGMACHGGSAGCWGGHGCGGGGHKLFGGHGCGGGRKLFGGGHGCDGGRKLFGGGHGCGGGGHGCDGGRKLFGGGHGCNGGGFLGGLFHRNKGCHGGSAHGCGGGAGCHGGSGHGCGGGVIIDGGHGCVGGSVISEGGVIIDGGHSGHVISEGTPVETVVPSAPAAKPAESVPAPKPAEKKKEEVKVPTPATIIVSLPAEAKLTFDTTVTKSTSSVRTFATPNLEPGKTFSYTLKAEVVRDGRTFATVKEVSVRAGELTRVNLDVPANLASK